MEVPWPATPLKPLLFPMVMARLDYNSHTISAFVTGVRAANNLLGHCSDEDGRSMLLKAANGLHPVLPSVRSPPFTGEEFIRLATNTAPTDCWSVVGVSASRAWHWRCGRVSFGAPRPAHHTCTSDTRVCARVCLMDTKSVLGATHKDSD